MPIKDKSLYPRNWPLIRLEILARAGYRCECDGICGAEHGGDRCIEIHFQPAKLASGRVILTTAHLNHNPRDNRRDNLRALCPACHLRHDANYHAFNAVITRDRKKGQLRLSLPDLVFAR